MVFYRKYRPQTIDELDSEAVKISLRNVLSQKEVPHAFLFTGPKGLGKTSTARIVAKFVNCTGKGEKPCNKCDSCLSITTGVNVDILEIDGASNRGIDEMRDLRDKIRLLPVSAKMKVYIIDEVHMLTTEAFNALLKTLEEPPAHAMFILCTTEQHKVPDTILSRCFHIQFKKATTKDLVQSFERIVKGEKMHADTDALELIATFSEGSFRDGAKILEEISLSLDGKKLTKELVDSYYHVTGIKGFIQSFLHALVAKDTKKGLTVIQEVVDGGIDIRYFTEQLLYTLHEALLEKVGLREEKTHDLDIETIKSLVTAISQAYVEMKYAFIAQLPLELVVVEISHLGNHLPHIADDARVEPKKTTTSPTSLSESQLPVSNEEKSKNTELTFNSSASGQTTSQIDITFLHRLLDTIKVQNHMLAGVLRSCKIHRTETSLEIEAPSAFHKEKLSEPKALDILEKVCEDNIGKKIQIHIFLKGGE